MLEDLSVVRQFFSLEARLIGLYVFTHCLCQPLSFADRNPDLVSDFL